MNLIAMAVLAPTLGFLVRERRHAYIALVASWATILVFQTHVVLLDHQSDDASYFNTATYFALNYTFLAIGIGIATVVHRRGRRRHTRVAGPSAAANAVTDVRDARVTTVTS